MFRKLLRSSALVFAILTLVVVSLPHSLASAAAVTNIRIFVGLGTGTDPNQVKDADALIQKWNSANPDIQVKFDYNDNATARDVLLTQVAGDQVPDIVG